MSATTRKFDRRPHCHKENSRKVSRTHGELMEVNGRLCRCKESWRNVCSCKKSWQKAQKVDKSWQIYPRPHRKLTEGKEGPTVARNVNLRFQECAKVGGNWRKVPQLYGMFTEDDTMFRWHINLTDSPSDARKADGSWWNVPWCTETRWMVPQMHGK